MKTYEKNLITDGRGDYIHINRFVQCLDRINGHHAMVKYEINVFRGHLLMHVQEYL